MYGHLRELSEEMLSNLVKNFKIVRKNVEETFEESQ